MFSEKNSVNRTTASSLVNPACTPGSRKSSLDNKTFKANQQEWSIPSAEVKFTEVLFSSQFGDVCRGRWHGDVMIYTFPRCKGEQDLHLLWQEVESLSRLRHENLQLFLGAIVEPVPSILTCMKKGPSLYEKIHIRKEPIPMSHKVDIARQVAQAVGYLHAKNMIMHKRMNSHNILLENKVKLCLIDQRITSLCGSEDPVKEELTYMSPELIRSIEYSPNGLVMKNEYTQESDVYAFGTIMYEMTAYRFPFERLSIDSIIWRVGSGECETVQKINCADSFRQLMTRCWNQNPARRLSFSIILRFLTQDNFSIHRRFSSSEPEKLNFLGQSSDGSNTENTSQTDLIDNNQVTPL